MVLNCYHGRSYCNAISRLSSRENLPNKVLVFLFYGPYLMLAFQKRFLLTAGVSKCVLYEVETFVSILMGCVVEMFVS